MKKVTDEDVENKSESINILKATKSDAKDIWEWRNDEQTKQMSISAGTVSWETHSSWYERSLVNPNRYLYLGFMN